jgi:hypothetical protein
MKGILEQPQGNVNQDNAQTVASGATMDPKLQEQMDAITANGLRMIHSKTVTDNLVKSIDNADDPVDAIANFTVMIIDRIESSAKQNNMTPDFGVLAQSANVLMGEIIQIAELSGIAKLSDEDKYRAYSLAVSKYIDDAVNTGKISKEQLQQMAEEAKQTPEGRQIMQASGDMGMEMGVNTQGGQPPAPPPAAPPPPSPTPVLQQGQMMPERRM